MSRFTGDTWLPAINVICWFLLVVAILGILTRIGTKLWIYRKLTKDDYVIIISTVSIPVARASMAITLYERDYELLNFPLKTKGIRYRSGDRDFDRHSERIWRTSRNLE